MRADPREPERERCRHVLAVHGPHLLSVLVTTQTRPDQIEASRASRGNGRAEGEPDKTRDEDRRSIEGTEPGRRGRCRSFVRSVGGCWSGQRLSGRLAVPPGNVDQRPAVAAEACAVPCTPKAPDRSTLALPGK